jgi:hypothetical protein
MDLLILKTNHSTMSTLINKGTGAGGANTNATGIAFETKTDNESRLLSSGWVKKLIPSAKGKYAYYLENADNTICYMTQNGLKSYVKHFHNKELFREPDEAYLFRNGDKYTLRVLEKKNQNGPGSVDTKLCAGQWFKDEYKECLGEQFVIEYAFCISSYLKKEYLSDTPKFRTMRKLHAEQSISVLFGDDEDYFTTLDAWLYS